MFDLSGRVALVTGASSGLGLRFGKILAAAGAKVVLGARRTDRLETVKGEIEKAGGQAIAVALDVVDEASTIAAYDAAEAAFGTVDTIIANAGVNFDGKATEIPIDEFDQTVAVNLRGAFLTVREGARRLIEAGSRDSGRGRVIIISSVTAFTLEAGLSPYSATKAGVTHMGKVLAREWVRMGINVNMICPGYIRTGINDEWFDSEAGKKQIAGFNRRRLMAESDLDAPLLYLASDASAAVTGSVIAVDDGQSL